MRFLAFSHQYCTQQHSKLNGFPIDCLNPWMTFVTRQKDRMVKSGFELTARGSITVIVPDCVFASLWIEIFGLHFYLIRLTD